MMAMAGHACVECEVWCGAECELGCELLWGATPRTEAPRLTRIIPHLFTHRADHVQPPGHRAPGPGRRPRRADGHLPPAPACQEPGGGCMGGGHGGEWSQTGARTGWMRREAGAGEATWAS